MSVKPILASQPDREVRAPLTVMSVYRLVGSEIIQNVRPAAFRRGVRGSRPGRESGGTGVAPPRERTAAGSQNGPVLRQFRNYGRHGRMVDLIPRSVLFGNPERTSPQISPDGSALAWIAPRDGVLNLWVAPAGGEPGVDWAAARPLTEDTDRGIRAFAWARDGRHVLYVQDVGGDENWRLYDVDPESLERRDLTPFEGIHATIIGTSKRRPD